MSNVTANQIIAKYHTDSISSSAKRYIFDVANIL